MTSKSSTTDMATDLARRLRAARVLSGKKVPELAKELRGIAGEQASWSPEKVYKLEQGRQIPDALELADFARATGQSLDFFYGTTSPAATDERGTLSRSTGEVKEDAA